MKVSPMQRIRKGPNDRETVGEEQKLFAYDWSRDTANKGNYTPIKGLRIIGRPQISLSDVWKEFEMRA